jgi:hypothetical protein
MEDLTKKQKGFVKDYIETDNATEAAFRNYDVKDRVVANAIGAENLAKPSIQAAIKSIADAIPDELLERVHLDGLQATSNDFPDYAVRHKYLDTAYKIKGSYAPDKSINLNVDAQTTPELLAKAKDFDEWFNTDI